LLIRQIAIPQIVILQDLYIPSNGIIMYNVVTLVRDITKALFDDVILLGNDPTILIPMRILIG
jgi:hypothetical protein